MLNKYPLWKYLLILAVLAVGLIYSAPNLYPDDPAVQITGASTALEIKQADLDRIGGGGGEEGGNPIPAPLRPVPSDSIAGPQKKGRKIW